MKCRKEEYKKYRIERRKKTPWVFVRPNIIQRCYNSNDKTYKNYGGKGIKCLITQEEIKTLWFRDKAWLLKRPSIDRKDNDGHYEYSNCQFIELNVNSAKDKGKIINQYSLDGKFIKEWKSISEASRKYKVTPNAIRKNILGKTRKCKNFMWKYKK